MESLHLEMKNEEMLKFEIVQRKTEVTKENQGNFKKSAEGDGMDGAGKVFVFFY